ncbi:MAG: hypothetical protein KDJ65_22275 [Anaerolineae bacterium]|nr:hypothetical protein [Anaerolineae bacterium]
MDLLKKVELLLNSKTRSVLPRRRRTSPLDEQEAELLAEIREALLAVEVQERQLAERIKTELAQADVAARRGDREQQRAHERRADELDRYLERESIQAIDLEEKLQALEEKLALAQAAVEKEGRKAATIDAEASKVLAEGGIDVTTTPDAPQSPPQEIIPDDFSTDAPDVAAKKSRLSE